MEELSWEALLQLLDQAGVPADVKWRTLVLYIRNMTTFDFLSIKQKAQLQELVLSILKSKNYSQEQYINIMRQQENILLGPHKEKLQMALNETKALLEEVHELFLRKKGDVQDLETTTVDLVEKTSDTTVLISSMREAFHEVVNNMEQDMDKLTQLSLTDQLTKLNNRRAFDNILNTCVAESLEQGWPLSLIILDIDHFKKFNDTYGHRIGDHALQVMADILKHLADNNHIVPSENYHPCRYGGEEFAIVLPHTEAKKATDVAEAIRQQVERCSFEIEDSTGEKKIHQNLSITISLGVQELDKNWENEQANTLIELADRKLYKAKASGRNTTCAT